MTEILVVLVVLLLFAAAAVVYARRVSTGRVTHRRTSTGLELRADEFPAPSPALAGPLSMHLEAPAAEARRRDVGPPPGLDDRRRRDVGPAGRHRRPDGQLPDGVLGMTGIMRKLDAAAIAADAHMQAAIDAETGRLPRVPS